MKRIRAVLPIVFASLLACAAEEKPARQIPAGPMPDTFRVAFETTKGRFVVEAYKDWSPLGVKRLTSLRRPVTLQYKAIDALGRLPRHGTS